MFAPAENIFIAHLAAELSHSGLPLFGRHVKRTVQRVSDGFDVVRVHQDRPVLHLVGGPGELTQN